MHLRNGMTKCLVAASIFLRPSCVSPQVRAAFKLRCAVSNTATAASTSSDLALVDARSSVFFWEHLRVTTAVEIVWSVFHSSSALSSYSCSSQFFSKCFSRRGYVTGVIARTSFTPSLL